MENLLDNIPQLSLWLGMTASLVLAVFMTLQALLDPPRRWRFGLFALALWLNILLNFSHFWLSHETFELFRVISVGIHLATLLWLLGFESSFAVLYGIGVIALGSGVWKFWRFDLATTVSFPVAFGIAAIAQGKRYWADKSYALAILFAYSTAMALLCASYYIALSTRDPQVISLGYFQFAILNFGSVLFGWIHAPPTLRGGSPVKIKKAHAIAFFSVIVLAEIGAISGQIWLFSSPPVLYIASTLVLLIATMTLYFFYRHQLVIHTDNIAQLLQEKTASLREMQEVLAEQNRDQKRRLNVQGKEIQNKSQVIARQRRLELAAQTAGQAAHDIQNLLSPLQEHIRKLNNEAEDASKVRLRVTKVQTAVDQLLNLNIQMLALSRRGRTELSPVNLAELLHEAQWQFGGKKIGLDTHQDVWVLGSWTQLARAVSNLISNALEACEGDASRVAVRCRLDQIKEMRRCHLGFLSPGSYGRIDIVDSGPGIPQVILEKIFEPFFSTKNGRQSSGTGLGLSIVTAIMEDHRAILDLQTSEQGTIFTLYIPATRSPSSSIKPNELSGDETVLVTFCDSEALKACSATLEKAGYYTISCSNPTEALKPLQVEQVDLLIFDSDMPGISGYDFLFAAIHLRPDVRAIVYSEVMSTKEEALFRTLGVSAFISKRVQGQELLRTIRRIFSEQVGSRS